MQKQYRIKRNEDISIICSKRQKYNSRNFLVYYNKSNLTTLRLAISVSKKVGNAVERNHAKRIVREILRPEILNYPNLDIVVVVKPCAIQVQFNLLKEELLNNLTFIYKKYTKSLKEDS